MEINQNIEPNIDIVMACCGKHSSLYDCGVYMDKKKSPLVAGKPAPKHVVLPGKMFGTCRRSFSQCNCNRNESPKTYGNAPDTRFDNRRIAGNRPKHDQGGQNCATCGKPFS
jgi:hypothetical protein